MAVFGYLIAHALFLERGGPGRRLLGLLPYLILIALWRVVFESRGLGSAGSGAYHDPGRDPLGYLANLVFNLPVLLSAQLGALMAVADRPVLRDLWINHNVLRGLPDVMMPMQFAIWQSYNDLLFRLVGEMHEANVPLLAGSDAVGGNSPGVFAGSSLHEELSLFVQAGLSPYEALRTATVNPAIYLEGEQEFGKVVVGFRADLVLLAANPLDDIHNTNTRVGVMKRGRWFPADELETALKQLAEDRK